MADVPAAPQDISSRRFWRPGQTCPHLAPLFALTHNRPYLTLLDKA